MFNSKSSSLFKANQRKYWVDALIKTIKPVLTNLSEEKLKVNMPVKGNIQKKEFSYLEAFGRILAGMAPWLELSTDSPHESKIKNEYRDKVLKSLEIITNPLSADYIDFNAGRQSLVDASFLALGFIRSEKGIWLQLPKDVQIKLIESLQTTREIIPHQNNWVLFPALIEAFFLKNDLPYDKIRIKSAINQLNNWYLGDGIYGDGQSFKWDYYNSYVIHPFLLEINKILLEKGLVSPDVYSIFKQRAQRYAAILERMISPEGKFPPLGRSITYRLGAFHLLSLLAYRKELPQELPASQARNALSAVLFKMFINKDNFDSSGWLNLGFSGNQPNLAENYINSGSIYLTSLFFLPLGLAEADSFWNDQAIPFTALKAWNGDTFPKDLSVDDSVPFSGDVNF